MATRKKTASEPSPILNGPYSEPEYHYATTTEGNLDYEDRRQGRRIFAPDTPQVPLGKQPQASMFDLNDFAAEYRDHLVNQLRDQVGTWRREGYPGVTSRVTRDLLQFWFTNPDRPAWQQLFYAQREAVETAIWLNEIADKSNPGTYALNQLLLAQETVGERDNVLPRIGFKMATGTGKTVVMACLVLYHYLNRSQYRNDPRYEVTKVRMHDELMQDGSIKKDKKTASFVTIGEPDMGRGSQHLHRDARAGFVRPDGR